MALPTVAGASNPISADESEARSLASPAVLKRMKRPAAQEETLACFVKWRALCPGLAIRSIFIVGFSGETEEEFSELLAFLEEAQLDRVGRFWYEAVQGAAANEIAPHVPEETKVERHARFMEAQQKISAKRMKRTVGARQTVIIDKAEIGTAVGRSRGDAPEIDGVVHVQARRPLKVGEIATVKIERADEYDLYGTAVGF